MRTRSVGMICVAAVVVLTLGVSSAHAQGGASPPATPAAPAEPSRMLSGVHIGGLTNFAGGLPAILGILTAESFVAGLGVALGINKPTADGDSTATKFSMVVYLSYLLLNKQPLSLGPEFLSHLNIKPGDPLKTFDMSPGLAVWATPFKDIPIALGFAWSVTITKPSVGDAQVDFVTPQARLLWLFY